MSKSLRMGLCSIFALSVLSSTAMAHEFNKVGTHAPIGVMGDHTHKQGEWMVGYRYEYSHFSGNKNGTNSVSPQEMMAQYGETPLNMEMEMHMFEVMYGLTDNLTLMVMPQYMKMDMFHASSHGGGHMHTHEVEGFGDTELTGLYSFYNSTKDHLHNQALLNIGFSLPTGKSDEKFIDHHGREYNLPYNMQFGSGTFDPILGATYTGRSTDWAWGAQTLNYIRMGKNNEGYRQGNKYTASTWIARNIADVACASFRLEGEAWENISGRDWRLPVNIIAGARPDGQAGERVTANIGVNLLGGEKLLNQRLALEFGVPVYERFDGPQPEMDYRLTAGWQMAF